MDKTFHNTSQEISDYVERLLQPEDSELMQIRQAMSSAKMPLIQVGPMDGLHLEVLTRAFNAKKVVEIGTLGGYSGVCIARGLPTDGELYTFEMSPHHAEVAKRTFNEASIKSKVIQFVGNAVSKLSEIEDQGPFDLVFIDADKANYVNYFKWAHKNLRIGGAVLADNTFAWGLAHQELPKGHEDYNSVMGIRSFNEYVAKNKSFRTTMLPTGEGLTLAVKISN